VVQAGTRTVANKQVIVLVSGQAGVGKTTFSTIASNFCQEAGFKTAIQPFALELKKIAIQLGWNRIKDEKGRQLLIDLGQAARRYDKDIWAKLAFSQIKDDDDFVFIDDWRFENEYSYLNKVTGMTPDGYLIITVKIIAENREILRDTPQYQDESERGLDNFDKMLYNYIIDNTGSMDKLFRQAKSVVKEVRKLLKEW